MWNVVDFITNSLYVATIGLRTVAYFDVIQNSLWKIYQTFDPQVEREKELGINTISLPREDWDTWDPTLISEGLFAAANIFSSLKLVYIFSVNPYLGPLQVHWPASLTFSGSDFRSLSVGWSSTSWSSRSSTSWFFLPFLAVGNSYNTMHTIHLHWHSYNT